MILSVTYDEKTWFHYDSETDDVKIIHQGENMTVPMAAVRLLIAEHIRHETLEQVRNMTQEELFSLRKLDKLSGTPIS